MEKTIWIQSIRSGILRKERIIDWAGLLPWRGGNDAWKCLKVSESLESLLIFLWQFHYINFTQHSTCSHSSSTSPCQSSSTKKCSTHCQSSSAPPSASDVYVVNVFKTCHIWQFKTLGRLISQEGKMKMIKDCLNLKASNVAQSTLSAKPSPPRRRCICPTK